MSIETGGYSHQPEQGEAPKPFDLYITVSRHGPKKGLDGPITEEGKQAIREYYQDAYHGVPIDNSVERRVVSSDKGRAIETASLYEGTIEQYNDADSASVEVDPRLSENDVMAFIATLPAEQKKDWFREWYNATERPQPDVAIGQEAIATFTDWLLDELNQTKSKGGRAEIDAFSHGPMMAAVLLKLEDKLGVSLLSPETETHDRLNRDKLFQEGSAEFDYLSNVNFRASSTKPNVVEVMFRGKTAEIPVSILEELAGRTA